MNMENLKNYLMERFPDAKLASGGRQVTLRCRFCGDSQKDKNARHLYIKVNGEVPLYKCFKCNESGILTSNILKRWLSDYDYRDQRILDAIDKGNEESTKLHRYRKNYYYNIYNDFIEDSDLSRYKLDYINNRLGLNLTYRDCTDSKIVLNLRDILVSNKIENLTRPVDVIEALNGNTVGFLSIDNSIVSLRSIENKFMSDKVNNDRWNVYTIFPSDNAYKLYTIPSSIYTISPDPVNVHIAEGAFDILSICYNLNNNNRIQNAYTAVNGSNYIRAVQMYSTLFGLPNTIYHLYPDKDITDDKLYHTINCIKQLNSEVYIHRNIYDGEKDMGVPLNRINESITKY